VIHCACVSFAGNPSKIFDERAPLEYHARQCCISCIKLFEAH